MGRVACLMCVVAALASGCAADDREPEKAASEPSPTSSAKTEPLTVAEAVAAKTSDEVVVRGWIYIAMIPTQKPPRLCTEIDLAGFAPTCGKPSLVVRGLPTPSDLDGTPNGTHLWSREPMDLEGTIAHGVLTVRSTPQ